MDSEEGIANSQIYSKLVGFATLSITRDVIKSE